MLKIGQGYDVHQLLNKEEFIRKYPKRDPDYLILGGTKIKHDKLLAGHSDADVLIHAIIDSILGALALGDIGQQFPDSSDEYEGISSLILLEKIKNLINNSNFQINNIDSTIIAEQPKLAKYINQMRINISKVLGINLDQISIKATTTEKLGFAGREEGIAAEAICLVTQK
jgi:2-C-methyl-D-erythritol 2,4-cyclodiphosphate synthase